MDQHLDQYIERGGHLGFVIAMVFLPHRFRPLLGGLAFVQLRPYVRGHIWSKSGYECRDLQPAVLSEAVTFGVGIIK